MNEKTNQPNHGKDGPGLNKEVAKVQGGAAAIPEHMRAYAGQGTENLAQGDYEMPRIKLLQGLSEELQAFDGLKQGMFFHTLAEESLGDKLPVVPLYISKRYVLWNPRHNGGGILARADDAVHWQPPQGQFDVKLYKDRDVRATWKLAPTVAQSGLAAWGTYDPQDPKSQPAATEVYVYVVALPSRPDLGAVALMLQRTALGPAKKWNGNMNLSKAPIFGRTFDMTSFTDDRGGQKFANYRFTGTGFVEDPQQFEAYRDLHERFKKEGVKVKDEDKADEAGETPVDANNADAGKSETKY